MRILFWDSANASEAKALREEMQNLESAKRGEVSIVYCGEGDHGIAGVSCGMMSCSGFNAAMSAIERLAA